MKLTDAEREALGRGLRDHDPEPYYPDDHSEGRYYAMYAVALTGTVERIVAARLEQQREDIAAAIRTHRPGFAWVCNCGQVNGEENWAAHVTRIVREYQPREGT